MLWTVRWTDIRRWVWGRRVSSYSFAYVAILACATGSWPLATC